jgi:hypothetical protein
MGGTHALDSYAVQLVDNSGTYAVDVSVNNGPNEVGKLINWSPSINTWYHVAVVYDTGGNAALYVNGVLQGTASGLPTSINDSDADFGIGINAIGTNLGANAASPFDGLIDDVRVYNVARTQSEIQSDMSTEPVGTEPGLVGAWNLNNNYNDSTANGNTLTPINGPSFSSDVHASPIPVINSFTTTPTSITQGQSSLLAWSVSSTGGTPTLSIDNGVGVVTGSSVSVSPTQTTTYTLTASNTAGTTTAQVTVTVTPPTPASGILKTSNQSVTNNTTLQNDNQLLLQLQPGTYAVDGIVIASSTAATPDMKIAFTDPTGSDMNIGYLSDVNSASVGGVLQASGVASSRIQLPANTPTPIMIRGTIVVTTAGTLQLQWAQFSSNAKLTGVAKGSYLKVTQL